MTRPLEDKRLALTSDVTMDDQSLELISAWYVNGKAKIFTRIGTRLDENPQIWAEILVGIVQNIAEHMSIPNISKNDCARDIVDIIQRLISDDDV